MHDDMHPAAAKELREPLFAQRTPEAAARQLAIVLAWSTELHLATLEGTLSRMSSPRYEVERQRKLCDELVEQCRDLGIPADVRGLRGHPCARLRERLLMGVSAQSPQRPR